MSTILSITYLSIKALRCTPNASTIATFLYLWASTRKVSATKSKHTVSKTISTLDLPNFCFYLLAHILLFSSLAYFSFVKDSAFKDFFFCSLVKALQSMRVKVLVSCNYKSSLNRSSKALSLCFLILLLGV